MKINEAPEAMNDLLALSHVPRWVIVPHIGTQTVAEHSFRVAIIMMELALRLDIKLGKQHYIWALIHDGPEAWSGDISGVFKDPDMKEAVTKRERQMCPWFEDLEGYFGEEERALVKLCDLIETSTFITMRGIGGHAGYAAERNLEIALRKAEEVAPMFGYGPERMREIVESVIMDIKDEYGRDPRKMYITITSRRDQNVDSPQCAVPNRDRGQASSSGESYTEDDKQERP